MKKAEIVIGSAFGDEGKGLVTDYLASCVEGKGCVVRFNGGAQAGHTVQTDDGKRHVFSHFGSGTFAGLPTYLSRFFVCNPIIFLRETAELALYGCKPEVLADPACPVTTPYDIMINQMVESHRGNQRHGSVGVGFGETLERQEHARYALCLKDLRDRDLLRAKLDYIRHEWVGERLAALGVTKVEDEWQERLAHDGIYERFIEDAEQFLAAITIAPLMKLKKYDHLIFEGAQGLLLDQDSGWFPFVTRSNTGVKNALCLARELEVQDVDVYYLTRIYTTRHGAGPLPHILPAQPYTKIVDQTNKPNPYQGSLRFAWFDMNLFLNTVRKDVEGARGIILRPHLAMTCLDQVDDQACFVRDGALLRADPEALAQMVAQAMGAVSLITSYGPTRTTVRRLAVAVRVNAAERIDILKDDDVAIEGHEALFNERGKLFVDAFA